LADGLRFLAKTIKDQRGMTGAMIAAIVMPAIVSVVMIGFMVILALFVVPVFVEIAPVEKWKSIGKILYNISYAITHYGIFMLIAAVAAICGFIWTLGNWTGAGRSIVDKHLPYSVYRDYNGALFLVALAVMMHSGDTLVRALEALKARSTPWLRWHIVRIIRNVDKMAGNYGESFATGIFSQQLTNRIVDYSRRSSELDKVISRIGVDGIEKVRKEVESGAKLMNSLLIAGLGALLAFMLVGTILTAQGLSESLKEEVNLQKIGK
jgi:toxin coregulated pilus biosynthesis protein E